MIANKLTYSVESYLRSVLIWIHRTYNSPLIYCMIAKIDFLVCSTTNTHWSPWHLDSTESICHCDKFSEGFHPDWCRAYRRLVKTNVHAYSVIANIQLELSDRFFLRCRSSFFLVDDLEHHNRKHPLYNTHHARIHSKTTFYKIQLN